MKNKEIILLIWKTLFEIKKSGKEKKSEIASNICDKIIKYSIEKGSCDNLSCIFIGFDNFFNNKESLNKIMKNLEKESCEEMIV
jgi:serine/threonine protein phosphatase PrpC